MRLSAAMKRVLRNVRWGLSPSFHLSSRSEWGGHGQVLVALERRGLVRRSKLGIAITETGRQTIDAIDK